MILRLVDEENVVFDEFSVASSDLGFIAFYWVGFTVAQSESTQEHRKVPYLTNPPIHIRKTATAPGSPYSFRIVRGFFYVPQNYQHSKNCETGPPAYRPSPRRLRQHFLLSCLNTLSVGPVGVSNSRSVRDSLQTKH